VILTSQRQAMCVAVQWPLVAFDTPAEGCSNIWTTSSLRQCHVQHICNMQRALWRLHGGHIPCRQCCQGLLCLHMCWLLGALHSRVERAAAFSVSVVHLHECPVLSCYLLLVAANVIQAARQERYPSTGAAASESHGEHCDGYHLAGMWLPALARNMKH
jgi:hypothetical protein